MDVRTGELIREKAFEELAEEEAKRFRKVKKELEEEAIKELEGKDKTFIDLKARTPLAKWAKQERKMDKKKIKKKRKIAKASRKRNRK